LVLLTVAGPDIYADKTLGLYADAAARCSQAIRRLEYMRTS
jgi:hypothetical protein